jgi:hypothetical protein
MDWVHTYREQQVPPGGTITRDTPGKKIAKAITEIQELALTNADLKLGDGLDGKAEIENNRLLIRLNLTGAAASTATTGGGLPDGGEQYQVLQRDATGAAVWDWVRAVDEI